MKIELLDTTLRDGEQTSGVSFASQEKLSILRLLLEELHVDRVEVASARVSSGEFETLKRIGAWAGLHNQLDKVEVLGFIDKGASLNWIHEAGCKVINLLCKGSLKHVTEQLRKTPEQHLQEIKEEIGLADSMGITVNIYLEDWSNGMLHSPDYVWFLMDGLKNQPIKRFMLPDTLGILSPDLTKTFCSKMLQAYPNLQFDFHAHNDYDLAVANVMAAVSAGINGIHVTVNGLGERAGNAPLTSVVAVLHDQLKVKTSIREDKLASVSKIVESYSGIRIPANEPVIGDNVFTQCAGIHADGDVKSNLYFNDLLPERFGRTREYALGKTSGKASLLKNLEALGIELDEHAMRLVTERIVELGDKKELVTQEDLPYIISDVLKQDAGEQHVRIRNYSLSLAQGLKPVATVLLEIKGESYQETSQGDGQYDAFMKSLRKIYRSLNRPLPLLTDYAVTIPPGGRTDAFVQTVITWSYNDKAFRTAGLDADQTEAAIKATVKMLNIIENWD
ncbi:MAG: alpha-isopropylmalate synthase regulatory domain-containing protein [Bacteroidota bacterium]|nr:alpha-isopropylmalate synthase regulatory domain-containing protein [Bacteroidota bacterium]